MLIAERLFLIALGIFILVALFLNHFHSSYYANIFIKEDGMVENATALGLLFIAILQLVRWVKCHRHKPFWWKLGVASSVVLFLFGAGEEISWGQRIFGIESNPFFMYNNAQSETNFHNLVVYDTKINKLIFGKLFSFFLLIYFLLLPWLYEKIKLIKNTSETFGIPIARWEHSIAFVSAVLLVYGTGIEKPSELLELSFAFVVAALMLRPKNNFIFE